MPGALALGNDGLRTLTCGRCKLTAGDGSSLGVTVNVTSVDGDDIKYDIKAEG